MSKNNYWVQEDNRLIETFLLCASAVTSATTRQKIFIALRPKINYMINNAVQSIMSSWSDEEKEEAKAEAMLKLWTTLSTKLDKNKLQGVLNFMWVSTNNILYSVARQHNNKKPLIEYNSSNQAINDYSEPEEQQEEQQHDNVREEILLELDRKIIKERNVNRINTVYLILLKEFLVANDFNSKGYQDYITDVLKISVRNFYQINKKLRI
jgi:hypothetical protein